MLNNKDESKNPYIKNTFKIVERKYNSTYLKSVKKGDIITMVMFLNPHFYRNSKGVNPLIYLFKGDEKEPFETVKYGTLTKFFNVFEVEETQ